MRWRKYLPSSRQFPLFTYSVFNMVIWNRPRHAPWMIVDKMDESGWKYLHCSDDKTFSPPGVAGASTGGGRLQTWTMSTVRYVNLTQIRTWGPIFMDIKLEGCLFIVCTIALPLLLFGRLAQASLPNSDMDSFPVSVHLQKQAVFKSLQCQNWWLPSTPSNFGTLVDLTTTSA